MPTTGYILSPSSGDTVTSPVTVQVGFTTQAAFGMDCQVGSTCEAAQQVPASPTSGTYTSAGIPVNPGTYTVYANNASTSSVLNSQGGVIVTGGTPPVQVSSGSGDIIKNQKRRKPVTGTTVAAAIYVVCLVYEIDTSVPSHTLIAIGAALVTSVGGNYTFTIPVDFKVKAGAKFLYVARVTAYDNEGASLGTQTQPIKK